MSITSITGIGSFSCCMWLLVINSLNWFFLAIRYSWLYILLTLRLGSLQVHSYSLTQKHELYRYCLGVLYCSYYSSTHEILSTSCSVLPVLPMTVLYFETLPSINSTQVWSDTIHWRSFGTTRIPTIGSPVLNSVDTSSIKTLAWKWRRTKWTCWWWELENTQQDMSVVLLLIATKELVSLRWLCLTFVDDTK